MNNRTNAWLLHPYSWKAYCSWSNSWNICTSKIFSTLASHPTGFVLVKVGKFTICNASISKNTNTSQRSDSVRPLVWNPRTGFQERTLLLRDRKEYERNLSSKDFPFSIELVLYSQCLQCSIMIKAPQQIPTPPSICPRSHITYHQRLSKGNLIKPRKPYPKKHIPTRTSSQKVVVQPSLRILTTPSENQSSWEPTPTPKGETPFYQGEMDCKIYPKDISNGDFTVSSISSWNDSLTLFSSFFIRAIWELQVGIYENQ